MNTRFLEVLQNPDLLVKEDIAILEKEISQSPFAQSIRALHLLATHRFENENFTSKLSETAAFTTDKKILYHLIHQKDIEVKAEDQTLAVEEEHVISDADTLRNDESEISVEPVSKVEKLIATPEEKFQEITFEAPCLPQPVYVDGELNRILFEGEENFLNEESEEIDLEASKESGTIVLESKTAESGEFVEETPEVISENEVKNHVESAEIQNKPEDAAQEFINEKQISPENINESQSPVIISEESETAVSGENSFEEENSVKETRTFTTEKIINEEKMNSEDKVIDTASHLSFHEINPIVEDESVNKNSNDNQNEVESQFAKDEAINEFSTEILIRENTIKKEEDVIENPSQLSFHGTQNFLPDVKMMSKAEISVETPTENKATKQEEEMRKLIAEVEATMKKSPVKRSDEKEEHLTNSKDLDFTSQTELNPPTEQKEIAQYESKDQAEENITDWKPMSFESKFSEKRDTEAVVNKENSSVCNNDNEKETVEESLVKERQIKPNIEEKSNIPVFINTWQSWLKLSPEPEIKKEDVKQKAIESFIESQPRISKLKEESSYSVKDRGDNISHLMTETLANLYLDQKLYSKAQRAFELLIEKDPQKADYFNDKIMGIKELRSQK